ncbi:MAG: hypothetical protein HPY54_14905 [Chthonomonadetes bacterium]|nr:hypothetical protein [Chthonomonadetes bacterium]
MRGVARRFRSATLILLAAVMLLPVLLAGCGKKEEELPPNYYTGPMKPKGTGAAGANN